MRITERTEDRGTDTHFAPYNTNYLKMVVYKLVNNYASLQMSLADKLEVLNRKNNNTISKVCDTQINFTKGQIQTNKLKGSSIFLEIL